MIDVSLLNKMSYCCALSLALVLKPSEVVIHALLKSLKGPMDNLSYPVVSVFVWLMYYSGQWHQSPCPYVQRQTSSAVLRIWHAQNTSNTNTTLQSILYACFMLFTLWSPYMTPYWIGSEACVVIVPSIGTATFIVLEFNEYWRETVTRAISFCSAQIELAK